MNQQIKAGCMAMNGFRMLTLFALLIAISSSSVYCEYSDDSEYRIGLIGNRENALASGRIEFKIKNCEKEQLKYVEWNGLRNFRCGFVDTDEVSWIVNGEHSLIGKDCCCDTDIVRLSYRSINWDKLHLGKERMELINIARTEYYLIVNTVLFPFTKRRWGDMYNITKVKSWNSGAEPNSKCYALSLYRKPPYDKESLAFFINETGYYRGAFPNRTLYIDGDKDIPTALFFSYAIGKRSFIELYTVWDGGIELGDGVYLPKMTISYDYTKGDSGDKIYRI